MIRAPTTKAMLPDGRKLLSRWLTNRDAAFLQTASADSLFPSPKSWQRYCERCVQRNKDAGQRIDNQGLRADEGYYLSYVYSLDGVEVAVAGFLCDRSVARDLSLLIAPSHRGQRLYDPLLGMLHHQVYTDMRCLEVLTTVFHDAPAARQIARNLKAQIGDVVYTPGGKIAHQVSHKPGYNPDYSRPTCTTIWSDYPDDHADFAVTQAPDFLDGLRQ